MSNEIERRYVSFADCAIEIEERSAAAPQIKGISPPFNSPSVDLGGFREVFAPGAFDRVIGGERGPDVLALFNHDESMVLGRTTSGTLELAKTDRGLGYAITPPDTQLGRDLLTLIRRGDIYGASFAFSIAPGGEQWSQDGDGPAMRTVTEVANLYDVSVVSRPAYPQSTAALRSLAEWRNENLTDVEQREIAEKAAATAADQRRRWSCALTAAAAHLLSTRLRSYGRRK